MIANKANYYTIYNTYPDRIHDLESLRIKKNYLWIKNSPKKKEKKVKKKTVIYNDNEQWFWQYCQMFHI